MGRCRDIDPADYRDWPEIGDGGYISSAIRTGLGIPQVKEFGNLKYELTKRIGFWLAFGKFHYDNDWHPCIWEFDVDISRDGCWGYCGDKTYEWKGLKTPPTYLKSGRECYLPGDVILTKEWEWEVVVRKAYHSRADRRAAMDRQSGIPAWLRLLFVLLNEGRSKTYKFGYQILHIRPDGDGTGEVDLQPVIYIGGMVTPIGDKHVGKIAPPAYREWGFDLNYLWWFNELPFEEAAFIAEIGLQIAQLGVGTARKLAWKAVRKATYGVLKDRVKKELRQKLTQAIVASSKALLAFAFAFAKELVNASANADAASTKLFSNVSHMGSPSPDVEKAFIKGIIAFTQTLFTEVLGNWIDSAFDLDDLGQRTAKWAIKHVAADMLPAVASGVATAMVDATDEDGNLDEQKFNKAAGRQVATSAFQAPFKKMVQDAADALADSLIP